ncbi:hypothetical protein Plo01_47130 [Planobispora longispora]|uniref:Uncharacterized protein n=1 Tax=Planobispora longispora TaxID=28887 RepID=A0A8J3RNN1_9ACTN|nr:hypothetical protein GCM10020093_019740 [Planobispora longispora]GIH78284.1 hypothetical protein Plo01_47130 [Planobispora longispora]
MAGTGDERRLRAGLEALDDRADRAGLDVLMEKVPTEAIGYHPLGLGSKSPLPGSGHGQAGHCGPYSGTSRSSRGCRWREISAVACATPRAPGEAGTCEEMGYWMSVLRAP